MKANSVEKISAGISSENNLCKATRRDGESAAGESGRWSADVDVRAGGRARHGTAEGLIRDSLFAQEFY